MGLGIGFRDFYITQGLLRVSAFTQTLHATCNYVKRNFMSNKKYDLKCLIPSCRITMFRTFYKYIDIFPLKKSKLVKAFFERGYFHPFKTRKCADEI